MVQVKAASKFRGKPCQSWMDLGYPGAMESSSVNFQYLSFLNPNFCWSAVVTMASKLCPLLMHNSGFLSGNVLPLTGFLSGNILPLSGFLSGNVFSITGFLSGNVFPPSGFLSGNWITGFGLVYMSLSGNTIGLLSIIFGLGLVVVVVVVVVEVDFSCSFFFPYRVVIASISSLSKLICLW